MINPMYVLPTIALVVAAFTGFNDAVLALVALGALGILAELREQAGRR